MNSLTSDKVRIFLINHFADAISACGVSSTEIGDDFDLLKAGIIDSLGVIDMISVVENHFEISVDFERMDPAELTIIGPFSRFVAENALGKDHEK